MTRPPAAQPKLPSRFSLHLQAVASVIWPWFLVWSALAFAVLPFQLGAADIDEQIRNRGLAAALTHLSRHFDLIWFTLGAASLYFHLAGREGLAVARKAAVLLIGGVALLCATGVKTGVPFGPLAFTGKLGWRFAGVPVGVPLLWFTLILSARYTLPLLWKAARQWPGWKVALGVATLSLLSALNLEGVARSQRLYWFSPASAGSEIPLWPEPHAFAAWFFAAFLLTLALPPLRDAAARERWKPLVILALLNAVFLATKIPL